MYPGNGHIHVGKDTKKQVPWRKEKRELSNFRRLIESFGYSSARFLETDLSSFVLHDQLDIKYVCALHNVTVRELLS